jgi:hypothetical protein
MEGTPAAKSPVGHEGLSAFFTNRRPRAGSSRARTTGLKQPLVVSHRESKVRLPSPTPKLFVTRVALRQVLTRCLSENRTTHRRSWASMNWRPYVPSIRQTRLRFVFFAGWHRLSSLADGGGATKRSHRPVQKDSTPVDFDANFVRAVELARNLPDRVTVRFSSCMSSRSAMCWRCSRRKRGEWAVDSIGAA